MRIKKVTRYYCDHCGKGVFRQRSMAKHEQGCTNNPNRVCGVCKSGRSVTILKETLDAITEETKDFHLEKLRRAADGCPACIFATLRQHPRTSIKIAWDDPELQNSHVNVDFDIKAEMDAYRVRENELVHTY